MGLRTLSRRAVQVFRWLVFLCCGIFCPGQLSMPSVPSPVDASQGFLHHDHRVYRRQSWVGRVGRRGGDCSLSGLVHCGAGYFHSFHKSLNGCIMPSVRVPKW